MFSSCLCFSPAASSRGGHHQEKLSGMDLVMFPAISPMSSLTWRMLDLQVPYAVTSLMRAPNGRSSHSPALTSAMRLKLFGRHTMNILPTTSSGIGTCAARLGFLQLQYCLTVRMDPLGWLTRSELHVLRSYLWDRALVHIDVDEGGTHRYACNMWVSHCHR
ncbi:hypothetical protein M758_UG293000 [Ceratodon purpureus]|nr:hypothetical protein M758_UG293000 [Ceratodon purpureus]